MSCFMSVNCFTALAYKKTFSLRNYLVFFSKCLKNDHMNAESTVQFWIFISIQIALLTVDNSHLSLLIKYYQVSRNEEIRYLY